MNHFDYQKLAQAKEDKLKACIGKKVKDIAVSSSSLTITFEDGTSIVSRQGDSGTMRDPEPYFSIRPFPPSYCKAWSGFDICGDEMPCKFHK